MSGSNEPHLHHVADLVEAQAGSIDAWMSALAASPAPRPKLVPTAIILRRARLEARLASQRAQTRRALRPAFIAEGVGVLATAVVGVFLFAPLGGPGLCGGLGDLGGIAVFAGLGSSSAVITILVVLLLLLGFVGDEPALAD